MDKGTVVVGADGKTPAAAGQLKEDMQLDNKEKKNPLKALLERMSAAITNWAVEDNPGMLTHADAPPATLPAPAAIAAPVVEPASQSLSPVQPITQPVQAREVKPVKGPAKLTFNAETGKWTVEHPNFVSPMTFASKVEAEAIANGLRANDLPKISFNADAKSFSITHKDWDAPVSVNTPIEAKRVVASKLVALGESEAEAQEAAQALIEQATPKAEEVPAESVVAAVVTADVKQTPKGGVDKPLVTGIPDGSDKVKSGPQGNLPQLPGRVVTEPLAKDVLPKSDTSYSMTSKHDGKYSQLAAQSEAEVKKLMSAEGLRYKAAVLLKIDAGIQLMAELTEALDNEEFTPEELVQEVQAARKKKTKLTKEAGSEVPKAK